MYRSKRYSLSWKLKLAGRREWITNKLSLPVFGVATPFKKYGNLSITEASDKAIHSTLAEADWKARMKEKNATR